MKRLGPQSVPHVMFVWAQGAALESAKESAQIPNIYWKEARQGLVMAGENKKSHRWLQGLGPAPLHSRWRQELAGRKTVSVLVGSKDQGEG